MSAALSSFVDYPPSDNIIPVDFNKAPVVTDYYAASKPKGDTALRLAAEAKVQLAKLTTAGSKNGTLRTLANTRGDQFALNPYLIEIKDDWNSRDLRDPANLAQIDSYARSIAEIGVQQALTVNLEGDRIFLTDGHLRLLATFRAIEVYNAEIKSVKVNAELKTTNEADRVLRQLLSGKPLTVLEQGTAFVKLVNLGWSPAQIAAKAGLVTVRVQQVLDLMGNANEGIKSLVATGKVSASEAAAVLRDNGNDADKSEKAIQAGLNVAEATGKTKATRKHIAAASGKLVSTKTSLKAVLANVTVNADGSATVPAADWAKIAKLLGL